MIYRRYVIVAVHREIISRVDTESVSHIRYILNGERNFIGFAVTVGVARFELAKNVQKFVPRVRNVEIKRVEPVFSYKERKLTLRFADIHHRINFKRRHVGKFEKHVGIVITFHRIHIVRRVLHKKIVKRESRSVSYERLTVGNAAEKLGRIVSSERGYEPVRKSFFGNKLDIELGVRCRLYLRNKIILSAEFFFVYRSKNLYGKSFSRIEIVAVILLVRASRRSFSSFRLFIGVHATTRENRKCGYER